MIENKDIINLLKDIKNIQLANLDATKKLLQELRRLKDGIDKR